MNETLIKKHEDDLPRLMAAIREAIQRPTRNGTTTKTTVIVSTAGRCVAFHKCTDKCPSHECDIFHCFMFHPFASLQDPVRNYYLQRCVCALVCIVSHNAYMHMFAMNQPYAEQMFRLLLCRMVKSTHSSSLPCRWHDVLNIEEWETRTRA